MISALKFIGKDDYLLMPVVTFRMNKSHSRDVLGAHACIRCHGYIERKPILIINLFEWVVRCVNCGRLYRRFNSHFERYPSDKKEWDEVEIKRLSKTH